MAADTLQNLLPGNSIKDRMWGKPDKQRQKERRDSHPGKGEDTPEMLELKCEKQREEHSFSSPEKSGGCNTVGVSSSGRQHSPSQLREASAPHLSRGKPVLPTPAEGSQCSPQISIG